MELKKDDKSALQQLMLTPGYKVLQKIETEARNELGELLLKSDLSNPEHLKVIQDNQMYIKARSDFLDNVEKHCRDSYSPNI